MRNYRDLQVWEKAHKLTLAIYRGTHDFPKEERFGLTSQIRRSSASIAANLAEGCGRRSDGEMARFIQISMGSGAELSYHLLLARDLGSYVMQNIPSWTPISAKSCECCLRCRKGSEMPWRPRGSRLKAKG